MELPAKNRILMLLENRPYPQDVRVRREATALTESGYKVSVICPADPGQPFRENVGGVEVYRYPAPAAANSFWGYLWEYGYSMAASFILSWLVFFRQGFDVVHAHNPPDTFVFVALLFKALGKRFVFDHHDLSPEMYQARLPQRGNPLVFKALIWLEKLTCRFADHVIATNESYKKMEVERDGVPEGRITVVRNGVELRSVRRADPDPGLRDRAKTIIGYVGVMGFQDGVDHLLRALHHLAHDLGRTDFYCVLIGDGDAWPSLQLLARELGLEAKVWFPGFIPNEDESMRRYLSAVDICVAPEPSNPYNDRSTMVKMIQYMSLGKPIVAFDLPEHRFTAGDAAVFVKGNDELAYARALAGLMDDPERRKALAAAGSRRFETALAWDYSAPKLVEAYEKILPGPLADQENVPPEWRIDPAVRAQSRTPSFTAKRKAAVSPPQASSGNAR